MIFVPDQRPVREARFIRFPDCRSRVTEKLRDRRGEGLPGLILKCGRQHIDSRSHLQLGARVSDELLNQLAADDGAALCRAKEADGLIEVPATCLDPGHHFQACGSTGYMLQFTEYVHAFAKLRRRIIDFAMAPEQHRIDDSEHGLAPTSARSRGITQSLVDDALGFFVKAAVQCQETEVKVDLNCVPRGESLALVGFECAR